jgi:23S rRNA-/tRNA-specific pseudouridylate synthase
VDDYQAGLDAATDYRVRERLNAAALLELRLHTGRQHQIRLHLEKLGHPLIGERVYSAHAAIRPSGHSAFAKAPARQAAARNMLHAWKLAFPHPLTGARIAVEAPIPKDFAKLMKQLSSLP